MDAYSSPCALSPAIYLESTLADMACFIVHLAPSAFSCLKLSTPDVVAANLIVHLAPSLLSFLKQPTPQRRDGHDDGDGGDDENEDHDE